LLRGAWVCVREMHYDDWYGSFWIEYQGRKRIE
jgi:hypothetical protein